MSGPANQPAAGETVRFGVFEADMQTGELRCRGKRVSIQELPFQALKLLVSRPNEVLSRDDFRQALWPDGVYVDFDGGVITAVKRLRDALGDSASNPIFVETVGRGYRWIAPVHREAPGVVAGADDHPKPSETAAAEEKDAEDVAGPLPQNSVSWRFITFALVVLATVGAAEVYKFGFRSNATKPAAVTLHPANHEAQELYLQGRFYWNKRTPESLNKAVDSFTQAIIHDPGYSQAYVGLADCYNLLREYSAMPPSEAYPRALVAAKKAVELDDRSSQAHASLAFASFYGMWDAATAGREFRRALELDSNNAVAHHWYANYLNCLRRFPEALAEIERAQALDPTSNSVLSDKGSILFDAGRGAEASALLEQVEEADPNFRSPHHALSDIYLTAGDYPDYFAEARQEANVRRDQTALAAVEASEHIFATQGARAMLQAMLVQQKKLYNQGSFWPIGVATTSALLGDKKEALFYLEAAYKTHTDGVAEVEIENGSLFHNLLRDEPEYRDLVAKIGLTPVQ